MNTLRPYRAFLLAALAYTLLTLSALLLTTNSGSNSHASRDVAMPAFRQKAVGPKVAHGRFELPVRATHGLDVRIRHDSLSVTSKALAGYDVSLRSTDAGSSRWHSDKHGAHRRTPFGIESIVINSNAAEELLTVGQHYGRKTWRWNLDTHLQPRLLSDGSVGFAPKHVGQVSDFAIAPVAIFDRAGKKVTPHGARWHIGGTSTRPTLELTLNDTSLPLPYVIDPAIHGTPTSAGALTSQSSVTITKPASTASGDLLFASVSVSAPTATTTVVVHTGGVPWTFIKETRSTTSVALFTFYRIAGSSEPASYQFDIQDPAGTAATKTSSGGIAAYTGVYNGAPLDAVFDANSNGTAGTSPQVSGITTSGQNRLMIYAVADTSATMSSQPYIDGPALMTSRWNVAGNGVADMVEAHRLTNIATTFTALSVSNQWAAQVVSFVGNDAAPSYRGSNTAVTGAAAASLTINAPTGLSSGDVMVAGIDVVTPTATTVLVAPGWNLIRETNDGNREALFTYYKVAGGSEPASYQWSVQDPAGTSTTKQMAGGIAAYYGMATTGTLDTSGTAPGYFEATSGATAGTSANVASVATAGTNRMSNYMVGTNQKSDISTAPTLNTVAMTIGPNVAQNGSRVGGFGLSYGSEPTQFSGQSTSGAVLSLSANWAAQVISLVEDKTAPTQTLSVTEGTNPADQYFDSATNTIYYNTAVGGDFTITSTPSDSAGTLDWVSFPDINVTGFTGQGKSVGASAYTSGTYSWTTSNTTAPTGTQVSAFDTAGNHGDTALTFTRDITAPTTTVQFPTPSGGYYNLSGWDNGSAGCTGAPGTGICGTVGDGASGSGVSTVQLSIRDGSGNYYDGSGFNSGTETFLNSTLTSSNTRFSYLIDHTKLTDGHTYTIHVKATDNVNNVESQQTYTFTYDTTAPAIGSVSLAENPDSSSAFVSGTTYYYRPAGGGGTFTVTANSVTDATSGVQYVTFPAMGASGGFTPTSSTNDTSSPYSQNYTWSTSASDSGAKNVTATDNAANTSGTSQFTVTPDSAAPTGQTITLTGASAPYYTSNSVTFTLGDGNDGSGSGLDTTTRTVTRETGTLSGDSCSGFTSDAGTYTSPDTAVSNGHCYRYTFTIKDNVGNVSSGVQATAKVDTQGPSNSLSLSNVSPAGSAFKSSTTVYYKGDVSGGGSFKLSNAVSDGESGPASSATAALGGTSTGWSHTASTVSTPSGGPYVSNAFSWSQGTSSSPTEVVTGADTAGNTTTASALTFTNDTTAPSVVVPSVTAGYYTSASVPVTMNTGSATDTGGSGVNASSSQLQRDVATLSGGSCTGWTGSWSNVSLVSGNDTSVTNGHCYEYREQLSDNVGNTGNSSASNIAKVDTQGPSNSLSLSNISPAGSAYKSSTTVYYKGDVTGGGSFQLSNAVTDSESGPASSATAALGGTSTGWSHTTSTVSAPAGGPYVSNAFSWSQGTSSSPTEVVTGADVAGNTTAASALTFTNDTTAPTVVAPSVTAGYYTTASVPVTMNTGSASDGGAGVNAASSQLQRDVATLSGGACGSFSGSWTNVTLVGGFDTSVLNGHCYEYREQLTDNVGNVGSSGASNIAKVDLQAPTNSLSLSSVSGGAFKSGTTVYYRGAAAGSFKLTNAVSDAESGAASSATAALGGTSTGWSHTPSTVSTPSGGPYDSNAFSWGAGTTSSPAETVTGADVAGNTTAAAALTFTNDANAPSGGALTVNVTAASSGGTSSYSTTGSFPIDVRTDYTETQSGSQSGLASSTLTRQSASLTGNSCGSFGSPTTISGNPSQTLTTGCYLFTLTGTDNVGNSTSVATTVMVDTSAPSAPTLTISNLSGNVTASGTTVSFLPSGSGSFDVTASSTDGDTGISGYTFPSAASMGSGWSVSGSGATRTYSFTPSAAQPGTKTVTATNGAGGTASSTFEVIYSDTTPPTTTIACNGSACGSGYYASPVSITLTADDGAGGSGVQVTRYTTDGTTPDLSNGSDYTGPISLNATTTVKFRSYDVAGNAEAVQSQTIQVDSTPPTGPTLTVTENPASGAQFVSGTTLYYRPGASGTFRVSAATSDPETGIASVDFPSITNVTGGGTVNSSPYHTDYTWGSSTSDSGSHSVTATNGVGTTSTASFTATPDSSAPTGQTITLTGGSAPYYTSNSVTFTLGDGTDSGSGLDTSTRTVTRETGTLSGGTCSGFTADPGTFTSPDTSVSNGHCYRYTFTVADNVGNVSSAVTAAAKVDTQAPTNAITLSNVGPAGSAFKSGATIFYNGNVTGGGSFTLTNAVSDGESGPASSTSAMGSGAGWSHTASTVSTPAGGPYVSNPYSWAQGTSSSPAATITGADAAGKTTATNLTFTNDITGPSVVAPVVTAGYYTTLSVPVTPSGGTDSGSAVAIGSSQIQRDTATLANGACGSFSGSWTNVTLVGGIDTSVTSGQCYEYRERLTDNVGNFGYSSASNVAKVDTNPPTNSITLSNVGPAGSAYKNGNIVYYNGNVTGGGSFTLTNGVSDAESGPASSTSGMGGGAGWSHSASTVSTPAGGPYVSNPYSWAQGTSSSPIATIIGADAAGNTTQTTLTFTNDVTAPSVTAPTVTAGYYTSTSVPVTANGGTDSGSGVASASSQLQRDVANLANGSCGAFSGSWTNVSLVGGADTSVTSGHCYEYREQLTDNVGNVGSSGASNVAMVDTAAPTNSLSMTGVSPAGSAFKSGTTIFFNGNVTGGGSFTLTNGVSDAESGVASSTTSSVAQGSAPTVSAGAPSGVPAGSYIYEYVVSSGGAYVASPPSTTVTTTAANGTVTVSGVQIGADLYRQAQSSGPVGQWIEVASNVQTSPYIDTASSGLGPILPQSDNRVQGGSGVAGPTGWADFTPGANLLSSVYNSPLSSTLPAPTVCNGWIVDAAGGVTFPAGPWTIQARVKSGAIASGRAFLTAAVYVTDASGNIVSTVFGPTDGAQQIQNVSSGIYATVSATTTSSTAVAANQHLCVMFWRHQTAGYTSTSAARWVSLVADDPSNAITQHPTPSPVGSYGGTLYLNGGTSAVASGSYQIASTAGPASTGWSHTISTVATPSGGPYVSNPFSWTQGTSSSRTTVVTGMDAAGNTSQTTFTFTNDVTAPTGGALTANGTAASSGGTTSYSSSGSFPINVRTDYTDGGSGLASSTLTRASATLSGDTCGSFGSPTTISGNPAQNLSNGCSLYTLTGADNVGNTVSITTTVKVDTTGPSAPSLMLANATGNVVISGTNVLFRPTGSGSFDITASSSDADSGISGYTFPTAAAMGSGWSVSGSGATRTYSYSSGAATPGTQSVTATNNAGGSASSNFNVNADSTAPTTTVQCNSAACSAGYYTSTPVHVTLSADDGTGSGVQMIRYTTDGSDPSPVNGSNYVGTIDVSVTTTIKFRAYDNVGNEEAVGSQMVLVDTSAPSAPSVTLAENPASGAQHVSGTTLYYRPGGSGTFRVSATSSDAESGIASMTFPAVTNVTGGGTVTSSPYQSDYTWGSSTTDSGTHDVTATNGAGLTASTPFTLTPDSTAPTGQTITLTGAGAPYYNTASVGYTLGDGTDSGSGLDSSSRTVTRETAPLTGDSCGIFTADAGTFTSPDTSVTGGHCYRYTFTIADNVGNVSPGVTAVAKVDTAAPTVNVTVPTEVAGAGNQYYDAGTKTQYFRPAGSGSFTLNATASDLNTAVASVAFPDVSGTSGWSGSGGTDTTSPYSSPATYSWSSGAAEPGAGTLTATDTAGNTGTDSVTLKADSTAPTGQTITLTGASAPYYTTSSVTFTLGNGTDAGSGVDVASGTVTRETAPFSGDSCGAFTADAGTFTSPDTSVSDGHCYRYTYTVADNVGNVSATVATTAKVDTQGPSSTLTNPGSPLRATVALSATASDAETSVQQVTFQYAPAGTSTWTTIGTDTTAPYNASWDTTAAADGSFDLRVLATDQLGNSASSGTVANRVVDNTAPDTSITAQPSNPSNSTTPTFSFSSTESGSTFECRIDGGSWSSCTSPDTISPALAAGSHTFDVRATDQAGNTDATAASYTWTIDLTAPDTTITAQPSNPSNNATPSFSFSSTESGSTFECRVDGGSWSSCTSPHTLSALSEGSHTFDVRATDQAGNTDATPASYTWTVDLTAPDTSIIAHPTDPSNSTTPSFSFSSTESGSTFECRIDGGSWSACTSPDTISPALAAGSHTFDVRATDQAGNTDATPASYTWTVDLTAPDTTITSSPPDPSNDANPIFAFTSSKPNSTFECRLDGGSWTSCTSPDTLSPALSAGSHTFDVRATDQVGNTDPSPASYTWTIDFSLPDTSIDSSPANPSNNTTPTFAFSSNQSPVTFECRLDGGSWTACISPDTLSPALAAGSHTFNVRAKNQAGSYDPSPASYTWTIDLTPPSVSITTPTTYINASDPVNYTVTASTPDTDVARVDFYECSDASTACSTGTWNAFGTDSTAPYSAVWTTPAFDGPKAIRAVAVDQAGNTGQNIRTITIDRTPPQNVAVSYPNGYVTGSVTITTSNGTSPDVNPSTGVLERATSTLTNDTCSSFGAFSTVTSPDTLASGNCAQYRYSVADNAGNVAVATSSNVVKSDSAAPTSSISDPGTNLRGTITLSAAASDSGGSGLASVAFQRKLSSGSSWTTIATDTTSPYSVSFDTTTVADGVYDFRTVATDVAGNAEAAPVVVASRRVDNTPPSATMLSPGNPIRGTITLTSSTSDAGSGIASVSYQLAPHLGAFASQPASWDTTAVADGLYDLRVTATDNAGNSTTSALITTRVDNTPPSLTFSSPAAGANVRGTVSLVATASDASPANPAVTFEYKLHSGSTWTPTSSSWNTTTLPSGDGLYDLRATANDDAGNVAQVVNQNILVDNVPPTVSITAPPTSVNGSFTSPTTFSASASDAGSGVANVQFFECSDTSTDCSTGSFNSLGTVAAPGPYSVNWPIPGDGNRALKVVATDNAGHTSSAIRNVDVDTTPPDTTITAKPADPSSGNVSFSFTSTETGSTFECEADGGAWSACTSPTFVNGLTDGLHTVQIRAIDPAGNTDPSPASWTWHRDSTPPTGALNDPGRNIRGTVTLTSVVGDPLSNGYASGLASVAYQYSADGITWATIGTLSAAPFDTISWNTTAVADGVYRLRIVATDIAGNVTNSVEIGNVRIDNTPPTTSQDDPGAYLRGTKTLTGSAADSGSGVDHVDFQRSPAGANTWTTIGTATTAPYSTSFDTTSVSDGHYDFRTVAYDVAANLAGSTPVNDRLIDNTPPTATMNDPSTTTGGYVRGTITLTSVTGDPNGTDGSGVASVAYEYSTDGATTWNSTGASLNTKTLPDGQLKLHVIVTDNAGNTTTSAAVTDTIDNTKPVTTDNAPSGYQSTDVTVTLSATDSGSGINVTEYSVDGGPYAVGNTVTIPAPADGSNDGAHTIAYFSADNVGNIEQVKSTQVLIDATPPTCPSCSASDYLRGTVTLSASPTPGASGIKSVEFQYAPHGTTLWTSIGIDTTGPAPYTVSWDTTAVADGHYDLQIIVTDNSNLTSTTTLPDKVVDNTPPNVATVGAPTEGAVVSGNVQITASAADVTSPIASVQFYARGSLIGTDTTPPYSFTWDSTTGADGSAQLYVVVTDMAGNSKTSPTRTVTVDNGAPSPTLGDPGSSLSGTVTLTATSDPDTAQVDFQRAVAGSGNWVTIATDTTAPFSTSLDTTTLADGVYDFRVVATDGTGNTGTSPVRANVRVDNTAPTGSLTAPSAGATVSGTVSLSVSASDGGSGVASVRYEQRPTGAGSFTAITTSTSSPFGGTWTTSGLTTGNYDLRAVITDAAGNTFTTTTVAINVDATAPTIVLADPGASISGVVTLNATISGTGATSVAFSVSPAGANTWQTIGTDTNAPYAASFDTTTLTDGLYDFRAVVTNGSGNTSSSVRTGVRVDNTAPRVVSSTPADGSRVDSAASIDFVTSEVVTTTGVTLDGAGTVTPVISGSRITYNTGPLAVGLHTLTGTLTDSGGKSGAFRISFTVWSGNGTAPPSQENAASNVSTTLSSADGFAAVTVPAGAYSPQAGDWIVVRITPHASGIGSNGFIPATEIVDVTAFWSVSGRAAHLFDQPLEIVLHSTEQQIVPATDDGFGWRVLRKVPNPPALPSAWADGYYVDASGYHLLTRHLTPFTLLKDIQPPSAPTHVRGVLLDNKQLSLSWTPGADNSGTYDYVSVFANGSSVGQFGSDTTTADVGAYDPQSSITLRETDLAGLNSAQTAPLRAVPALAGRPYPDVLTALATAGFRIGNVVEGTTGTPGTVTGPTNLVLAQAGTAIDLTVAPGTRATTKFLFGVTSAKKFKPTQRRRGFAARLVVTRAARITGVLYSPRGKRLYTWHFAVKAGKTIVKLRLPAQVRRPGVYSIRWSARSGADVATRTVRMRLVATGNGLPTVRPGSGPLVVVLAGSQIPSNLSVGSGSRKPKIVTAEDTDNAFNLAGSGTGDVQVMVVDVDEFGIGFVRDLHTVFPSMKIVALAREPRLLAAALKAGATVALPSSTPSPTLAAVIAKLLQRR